MSLTDEIMAQVETRLYQGRRPNSSKRSTRVDPPIEEQGQSRRSDVQCGRVALLRNRANGSCVATRLFCKRKACPECGPRRRGRLASHYREVIGTTPVVRLEITRRAWATTSKRLARSKASYVRIPAPDDRYIVVATAGPGEPITDLAATLASAFEQMPSDEARVSSSRAWALEPAATGATGAGDGEGGWELLGFTTVTLDDVVQVARDLGLYVGQVADRELAPDWAEAHLLRLPEEGTLDYRRFAKRIGLHWPSRGRADLRLAA